MHRALTLGLTVAIMAGCDSHVAAPGTPDLQPEAEFGTIAVQVNGARWFMLRSYDSVIGYIDPQFVRLSVQAPNQGVFGAPRRISMGICGVTTPQAYSFAAPGHALVATWTVPGQSTRPRGKSGKAVYSSVGAVQDSLVIDELDGPTGRIRGRFHFQARVDPWYSQSRASEGQAALTLAGFFAGRIINRYLHPCPSSLASTNAFVLIPHRDDGSLRDR